MWPYGGVVVVWWTHRRNIVWRFSGITICCNAGGVMLKTTEYSQRASNFCHSSNCKKYLRKVSYRKILDGAARVQYFHSSHSPSKPSFFIEWPQMRFSPQTNGGIHWNIEWAKSGPVRIIPKSCKSALPCWKCEIGRQRYRNIPRLYLQLKTNCKMKKRPSMIINNFSHLNTRSLSWLMGMID